MKVTLKTLTRPGFEAAFVKLCAEPFTPAEKFRLARAKRAIEEALTDYSRTHAEIIRTHSADGQGNQVDVTNPTKFAAFRADMEKLAVVEVELNLPPLALAASSKLDANDLAELIEFLAEPKQS